MTPAERLPSRWAALWEAITRDHIDALVVAGRGVIAQYGSLAYVAGYCPLIRMAYAVLPRNRPAVLIVPTNADLWLARQAVQGALEVQVSDGEGALASSVIDVLQAIPELRRIGIAGLAATMPASDWLALRDLLPAIEMVDAARLLGTVKAVKDKWELAELEASADLADDAMRLILAEVGEGSNLRDLVGQAEGFLRARGAHEVLVYACVEPHFVARPRNYTLRKGDLAVFYVELAGATGHWVELARMAAIGPVDASRQALAATCLAAMEAAEARLTAGSTAAAVARAIDAVAGPATAGIWHGHGVGLDHDLPAIGRDDQTVLKPNMVLAIHPSLASEPYRIGASIADTYVITETKPRRLSELPKTITQSR